MKLRRALAAVATTAAIAPAALITASTAFADESASPSPAASASATRAPTATPSEAPSATAGATPSPGTPGAIGAPSAGSSATTAPGAPAPGRPGTGPTTPSQPTEPPFCDPANASPLTTSIAGLPGKIVAGSGWHDFTLTVKNPSTTDVPGIHLFAGVAGEQRPYTTRQIALQAYFPDTKQWKDISDHGFPVAYFGWTSLPSHYVATVPLRINVKATAPVGHGLTIGGGFYLDAKQHCIGNSGDAYEIRIVAPGTDTTGSKPKPQGGGKVPVPTGTPKSTDDATTRLAPTGTLAHTGSSSALPLIAGIGAAAVVAGGGAMFVVRRRKGGNAAA